MKSDFKKMLCIVICGLIILSLSGKKAGADRKELIQIAILLDTSNSMDGLISQAKSQLWKIVNELSTAKKNGKSPSLEVALFEYGNSSISQRDGYIRNLLQLTGDLDSVSEKLFALTTNGGDEYCGQVIESAINNLKWDSSKDTYKVIFIAGNEPFTQGSVDYTKSCKKAISKGIIINTIFCGNQQEGISGKWKDGADIADGRYMNIDQNETIAYIEAPQDKEIAKLGEELNKTYIAYGPKGEAKKARQAKEDMNAGSVSAETAVQRSVSKASAQYNNADWDLLDAVKDKNVDLGKVEKEQLPPEMQKMSGKERSEYLDKMSKKRSEVQKKINTLNEERRKYVEKEMKNQSKNNTLDAAIINTIHEQAVKKDYKFN